MKRRGFKTEKAALLAEAKLEAEDIVEEVVTFEFVANKYMEWYKKRRKVSSYKKIESVVRVHLIPYFKRKQIKNIRARDVVDFQDTLIGEKSPAHIKRYTVFYQLFLIMQSVKNTFVIIRLQLLVMLI